MTPSSLIRRKRGKIWAKNQRFGPTGRGSILYGTFFGDSGGEKEEH